MIKSEFLNNNSLIKHFSDQGVFLRQVETGAVYAEPIDIYPCPFTYEETEEKIEELSVDTVDNSEVAEQLKAQYIAGKIDLAEVKEAFLNDKITADEYKEIISTKE